MFLAQWTFPDFDPVIFHIGSLSIKWYGVMFVSGFLVGNWLLKRLSKERRLRIDVDSVNDLLIALMIGVILGGRLGYVLWYHLDKYLENPVEFFKIWQGGLSFHGGLVGAFLAVLWFSARRRVSVLNVMDACALSGTPGILFVRVANFINGELYGRPTTSVPWRMVFPKDTYQLERHPSQLYEGLLEGAFLFCVLWLNRRRSWLRRDGRIAGCFLMGYAVLRFLIEFVRDPDPHLGAIDWGLSRGQTLSLAMAVFGAVVFWWSGRTSAASDAVASEGDDTRAT
ncbi:MAG: prolipoprotein diacylglyceryl transferase [Planctomycetes bacterium]|nr:prolipoprotein diacylglyceryl transferase [Planctomycetota bacterium]